LKEFVINNNEKTLFFDMNECIDINKLNDEEKKLYFDDYIHYNNVGYDKVGQDLFNFLFKKDIFK
jgi:lysophospholipase L1-like esterase